MEMKADVIYGQRKRGISGTAWLFLGGFLGSLLVYLLDPNLGRRRRSIVRDKINSARKEISRSGERKVRDINHRMKGWMAELNPKHNQPDIVDDHTLIDRVRSRLGRVVAHSRSIDVNAEDGVITLSGPVMRSEVAPLIVSVERTRGVRGVVNRLQIHSDSIGTRETTH
jgi:hypothetical protein